MRVPDDEARAKYALVFILILLTAVQKATPGYLGADLAVITRTKAKAENWTRTRIEMGSADKTKTKMSP